MTEESKDPKPFCDLIMKGGITSGVVYPRAIAKISEAYQFEKIGGTSAGAIAAGVAAAAEYARAMGHMGDGVGMEAVNKLPEEFAGEGGVLEFFHPAKSLKRLFDLAIGIMNTTANQKAEKVATLLEIVALVAKHYLQRSVILWIFLAVFAGLAWGCWASLAAAGFAGKAASVAVVALALLGVLTACTLIALSGLVNDITKELPINGFGICPGVTIGTDKKKKGITDWLAEKLNTIAGLKADGPPLTFRMLEEDVAAKRKGVGISAQMMTTNLSRLRPHRLPMENGEYYFKREEFDHLFPCHIVDHMVEIAKKDEESGKIVVGTETYWRFPGNRTGAGHGQTALDLPVVVALRMSLSFPVLFQAIPLYTDDHSLRFDGQGNSTTDAPEHSKLVKCWFSDGGISSNFPMHFFDRILPKHPVFGISLGPYDIRRNGTGSRIHRPEKAREGQTRPVFALKDLPGFIGSIVSAAMDWQDSLLSQLAGFRERVATVYLKDDEGGMNLNMTGATIEKLSGFGGEAGANLIKFEIDEHRWRRFLVAYDRVTTLAQDMREVWQDGNGGEPMRDFVKRYAVDAKPGSFADNKPATVKEMAKRMDELARLAEQWSKQPVPGKVHIPKPESVLRVRPTE